MHWSRSGLLAGLLVMLPMNVALGGQSPPDSSEVNIFKDCDDDYCPEMVVIPAGSFRMGTDGEPRRNVEVAAFAIGRLEVTRGEYSVFASATNHAVGDGCLGGEMGSQWEWNVDMSRSNPGFHQDEDHPVVCVSWADAAAYAAWLSGVTGAVYRLPSAAEFEYVVRAGWRSPIGGEEWNCEADNIRDQTWRSATEHSVVGCNDGRLYTAAAGSLQPNAFGIHDILGNVREWVADCWHDDYAAAPVDARAWLTGGECDRRAMRGGSWIDPAEYAHPAHRHQGLVGHRFYGTGFRVARTLD